MDILLIEDNEELGQLIFDFVRNSEYTISWVQSAEEALQEIENTNYRLLLLDVMLPGQDGFSALACIRKNYNMPVLMMSARTDDESKILGMETGADDYIAKPCDLDILRTRILSLLKRRQRLRQEVVNMQGHTELVEFKSQLDRDFMRRVFRIIEGQLSNTDFSIGDLCYELAMSRSSVYNKIKTLTGRGPNDIIKIVRLSRARDLLTRRPWPIADVATMVGFSDPKYFSTCFKKEYGISPSKLNDETRQDT